VQQRARARVHDRRIGVLEQQLGHQGQQRAQGILLALQAEHLQLELARQRHQRRRLRARRGERLCTSGLARAPQQPTQQRSHSCASGEKGSRAAPPHWAARERAHPDSVGLELAQQRRQRLPQRQRHVLPRGRRGLHRRLGPARRGLAAVGRRLARGGCAVGRGGRGGARGRGQDEDQVGRGRAAARLACGVIQQRVRQRFPLAQHLHAAAQARPMQSECW